MKSCTKPFRKGLTLIELIVVLVVLIGLAGIIIPMLPNMITRTHTSAAATNIPEINKAVQTYEGLFNSYPDGWDALTDGTNVVDYLPGGTGFDLNAPRALNATELANLNAAGITTLYKLVGTKAALDAAGQSPTFDPWQGGSTAPTKLNLAGDSVITLGPSGIAKLNLSPTGTYLVVGLGKLSKMVGRTIAEPPYHFLDDPNSTPNDVYARYAVIFKVSDPVAAPTMSRAVIVAVVGFHSDGIASGDAHIREYFNAVKAAS